MIRSNREVLKESVDHPMCWKRNDYFFALVHHFRVPSY